MNLYCLVNKEDYFLRYEFIIIKVTVKVELQKNYTISYRVKYLWNINTFPIF